MVSGAWLLLCSTNKGTGRTLSRHNSPTGERDSVRRAYNHALYLDERRRMMQNWADYLDSLKAAKD